VNALIAEKRIKFPDAASAVAWAEEMLDRAGGTQSQIGKLTRVPGGSEFTMAELQDQALTIVLAAQGMEPAMIGRFFLQIFGRDDALRRMEICGYLVAQLRELLPQLVEGRHHLQLVNLADAMLRGYRSYVLLNRRQRMSDVARSIGVSRQTLYKDGWADLIKALREKLAIWQELGERSVCDILNEKGYIA